MGSTERFNSPQGPPLLGSSTMTLEPTSNVPKFYFCLLLPNSALHGSHCAPSRVTQSLRASPKPCSDLHMGLPTWPLSLFLRLLCSALSTAAAPRECALGGRSSLQLVLCCQEESWLWTHTAYARPLDCSANRATALLKQRDLAGIQACPHLSLLRLVFAGSLCIRGSKGAFEQGPDLAILNCLLEQSVSPLVAGPTL